MTTSDQHPKISVTITYPSGMSSEEKEEIEQLLMIAASFELVSVEVSPLSTDLYKSKVEQHPSESSLKQGEINDNISSNLTLNKIKNRLDNYLDKLKKEKIHIKKAATRHRSADELTDPSQPASAYVNRRDKAIGTKHKPGLMDLLNAAAKKTKSNKNALVDEAIVEKLYRLGYEDELRDLGYIIEIK